MLVRGMQTGRTKTVGVMLPFVDEFYGHIINGVHDELVKEDHVPLVLCSFQEQQPGESERISTELQQIYRMIDRRVDGIILHPVDDAVSDEYLHEILDRHIPLISVDRELEYAHADFVGTDDERIGALAAERFIELVHNRLGQIAGPSAVTTVSRRRQGFERAAAKAGVQCLTVISSKFNDGSREIPKLFQSEPRPTAIFAGNDILASQTYKVAKQLGLQIPRDLSVIGCSNLTVSRLLTPELSTFEHFPEKIGAEAAKLLLRRLKHPDAKTDKLPDPRRVIVDAKYIERSSSAAPPRD